MEHLNTANIILTICGLLIYTGMTYQNRRNKNVKFSFGYWIQDNWMKVVLSVVSAFTILLFLDDLMDWMGLKDHEHLGRFERMTALFAGLLNYAVIEHLYKYAMSIIKKKAG